MFIALLGILLVQDPALALTPLCNFNNARLEHSITLQIPGTRESFANAWGYSGISRTLNGVTGFDSWGELRFEVVIEDTKLKVSGEFDPNEANLFSARKQLDLGGVGIVLKGGTITVLGRSGTGMVAVTASKWAREQARSYSTESAELACSDITIHRISLGPDKDRDRVAAAGLDVSQSQKVYLARRRIPIHDRPDGARIGHFERLKYPLGALELEHREGWHHVAVAHWQGTIWHGWIRGKYLQEPQESSGVLGGIGGLLGQGRELQAHRCTSDLPLVAFVRGSEHPVGTVKAGALLSVKSTEPRKGWVSVELPDAWLRATEESELQVPSTVLDCPIESWTSGKLK